MGTLAKRAFNSCPRKSGRINLCFVFAEMPQTSHGQNLIAHDLPRAARIDEDKCVVGKNASVAKLAGGAAFS